MLLFISYGNGAGIKRKGVSIHLMLLFIIADRRLCRLVLLVSIHLMLLFINTTVATWRYTEVSFNTSHVVIYPKTLDVFFDVLGFQYISCCYLSWMGYAEGRKRLFQYISCCYLSEKHLQAWVEGQVSIHLMLLFILVRCCCLSEQCRFQYISCCYLSCSDLVPVRIVCVFQYISCCYLSGKGTGTLTKRRVSIHLMLLFITLSTSPQGLEKCFNTSHVVIYLMRIIQFALTTQSFNTSHVVIYLTSFSKLEILFSSFNTSHVVIYHKRINFDEGTCKVSIHLMLLFISTGTFLTM